MNGPEHYREAEKLASRASGLADGDEMDRSAGLVLAALAQAHATLAVAAATAEPAVVTEGGRADSGWLAVLDPERNQVPF